MCRHPLSVICLSVLLATPAAMALAAGTGPTNPTPDTRLPINTQPDPAAQPGLPPSATGTDPRQQGDDMDRQGASDMLGDPDNSLREAPDGSGSEHGGRSGDGHAGKK